MATLLLATAGAAIGGGIGGAVLGVGAATIGGAVGSLLGSAVDARIMGALAPSQRVEGARLGNLQVSGASEGAVLERVWGRMRVAGTVIWATELREEVRTSRQGGAKINIT